jgi:hypothetical protein
MEPLFECTDDESNDIVFVRATGLIRTRLKNIWHVV